MMVNSGSKHPPCSRCGRGNHALDKCVARKHVDGTVLNTMGTMNEVDYERNGEEVSTKRAAYGHAPIVDVYCGNELVELMFLQPDANSLTDRQKLSSKTGISDS